MAVGLYLCVPLTVAVQVAWTRLLAPLLGMSAPQLVRIASQSLDPFIEELMKVLPLTILLMVPTFKRQWSFTDFVLIAAAIGAGFGLGEDLYRFAGAADRARPISGGWALAFSNIDVMVPSIGRTLTSWLPGVTFSDEPPRPDLHLIWTGVCGLAVGLVVLLRTKAARLTALGLFVCISLDHAANNISNLGESWLAFVSWPLVALAHLRSLMPLAALAAAWWLDQQRQGSRDCVAPLLQAERSASNRMKGTLGAAFSRLPWSLVSVDRFVRMRRAVRTEQVAATDLAAPLRTMVENERDRVEQELAQWQTGVPALLPPGWTLNALRAALRRPAVITWLVIMTPSVLWFVVGGWPQTAGLQAFLLRPGLWKVLFPLSVLAQAWISWRTIAGLRSWSQSRGATIGDEAALVGLRIACGIGAVSLGAFSLLRMLGGLAPGSSILASLHAQDAANRLTPGGGSMIAGSGAIAAPPPHVHDAVNSMTTSDGSTTSDAGSVTAPPPSVDMDSSSSSPAGDANSNDDGDTPPPPTRTNNPPPSPAAPPEAPAPPDAIDDAIRRADQYADELATAQQRLQDAQTASEASDVTNDFKDPWAKPGESADEVAKAAEQQAKVDLAEAKSDAALANAEVQTRAQEAQAAAEAAQSAAAQQAAAQRQAADPMGFAADEAAKAAADAQRQAEQAFNSPDHEAYRAALERARQARQNAEAARAAADAAKTARETYAARSSTTGWKPDKP